MSDPTAPPPEDEVPEAATDAADAVDDTAAAVDAAPAAAVAAAAPVAATAPAAPIVTSAPTAAPATPAPAAPAERPMGITILAILGGASGVVNAVIGILLFTVATTIFGLSGAIFGIAVLAMAALSLAFAVGAIQMQPWAWPLGMVLALAGIAVAAVLILGGSNVSGISLPLNVLEVALYGAIAYYLNQGSIKALFGR